MRALALSLLCLTGPAFADVPKVVTDIAPVHGLVSQVMKGVGAPELILPAKVSPHHHAMRPSQARMLAAADLVVWIGGSMTPWLEGPVETLPEGAQTLTLSQTEGLIRLELREAGILSQLGGDHGHDHGDDHGEEHADEEDHNHAKEEDHGHDVDHGHAHGDEDEKDHANEKVHGHEDHQDESAQWPLDPHLWLDPANALLWLDAIAGKLAQMDPENADTYRANAAEGRARIEAQRQLIAAQLAPQRDQSFVVLHDAFQYFERAFGLEAFAAVKSAEADAPGAARLTQLREGLKEGGVRCALSEPQISTELLEPLLEGTTIKVRQVDPLGAEIAPGHDQYTQLLQAMADSFTDCLSTGD